MWHYFNEDEDKDTNTAAADNAAADDNNAESIADEESSTEFRGYQWDTDEESQENPIPILIFLEDFLVL